MARAAALALTACVFIACQSSPDPREVPRKSPTAPAAKAPAAPVATAKATDVPSVYGLKVRTLEGEAADLASYQGRPAMIVNTASQCGFTPQYEHLQALYEKYQEQGFVVLAFPSNDFGSQEPGSPEEIAKFVEDTYGVTFPMFAKTKVRGDKDPIYTLLTEQTPEGIKGDVKWNFTKFLVDAEGRVVKRWESGTNPMSSEVTKEVEALLRSASAK